jgi:hypothetical protein
MQNVFAQDFTVSVNLLKKSPNKNTYYLLAFKNKECTFIFGPNSELAQLKNLKQDICVNFYKKNEKFIEAKIPPLGDLYHPNLAMADLHIKNAKNNWTRIIRVQKNKECNREGICKDPDLNMLYSMYEQIVLISH